MKADKVINVKGMHCRSCEMLLIDAVSGIRGVETAEANSRKGTVTVKCSDDAMELVLNAIRREGYKV